MNREQFRRLAKFVMEHVVTGEEIIGIHIALASTKDETVNIFIERRDGRGTTASIMTKELKP